MSRSEVHIPKSAGSSFAYDALSLLQGARLKLISQEGCLALHQQNPRLLGTMTMLRDPRQHVLSQQLGMISEHQESAVTHINKDPLSVRQRY